LKKSALYVLLLIIFCGSALAQVVVGVPGSSKEARDQSFELVWSTVKEKHFDPTLGGLDWDKVRQQYLPKAAAAKTDSQFYAVLREMLGELHQSHFNIIPPESVVEDDSPEPRGGGIGIDIRLIDDSAVITRVDQGSSGAAAGLRTGFVVQKVDDVDTQPLISQFQKSTESQSLKMLRATRAVMARLSGLPQTSVRLTCLDQNDQTKVITVSRERLKGEMSQRFGNFGPQYTEFEAKRLADGTGYIRFNIFVIMLMDRIRGAIREMSDAPGIIIDLRGNPGGLGGMAPGIMGNLAAKEGSLGTMHMRSGTVNFAFFPQKSFYTGPIVVLTDGASASTSEIFAAGLQELGRAVIVGETTAGAALPSILTKLPTGAIFQYAIGDFKTPRGTLIEGRGVVPDVETKLTRRSLLEGRDIQLEAAQKEIKKLSKDRKAAAGGSKF